MKKTSFAVYFVICLIAAFAFSTAPQANVSAPPAHPRQDATVEITFDGLMALCLGDPSRVSVGILNVEHHRPELRITKVKSEQKTPVAIWRGELRDTLYLDVESHSQNVSRYQASAPATDPNDFSWTVDLESDLFQRELYVKEESLVGKIHINAGLFYGRNLSEEKFRFFDNTGKALPFDRQVAEPAAKLNLAAGDALIIKSSKETLRLAAEPGVRYQIEVTNLPPADMAAMDHWLYYYDVLGAKVTPYTPVMVKKAAFAPRPLLCLSAVFSKSRLK